MKKQRLLRHEEVLKRELKDPEFRKYYEEYKPKFQIALALYKMRTKLKLTQKQMAERLGIKQPSYAELEDMEGRNYTIDLLQRIAKVTRTELYIRGAKVKFIQKKAA